MFNLCFQRSNIEVKLTGQTKQLQAETKASRFNNYLEEEVVFAGVSVNTMAQKVLNEFC